MNYLSEKELLELKEKYIQWDGAYEASSLSEKIPDLVDEILELRRELKDRKDYQIGYDYGDWRDIYG